MTIKRMLGWSALVIFMAYVIWVQTWSDMAKQCHAKGGSSFDWLDWSCHRHERL